MPRSAGDSCSWPAARTHIIALNKVVKADTVWHLLPEVSHSPLLYRASTIGSNDQRALPKNFPSSMQQSTTGTADTKQNQSANRIVLQHFAYDRWPAHPLPLDQISFPPRRHLGSDLFLRTARLSLCEASSGHPLGVTFIDFLIGHVN